MAQSLKALLTQKNAGHFIEELYIQTDRDVYIAGETVQLKVYKMEALNHGPVNISKVVYLELINELKIPVNRIMIRVDEVTGPAYITLSDTLSSGHYILRGYTNWMKNDPENLFFFRTITVINPFKEVRQIKFMSEKQVPDSVIFYPEGGYLVKGITSRLGIRVLDQYGMGIGINGIIMDQSNDTITTLITNQEGFGHVRLSPDRNASYHLVTTHDNNSGQRFSLPHSNNSGILLTLKEGRSPNMFTVGINKSNQLDFTDRPLFLVLHMNGFYAFCQELDVLHDSLLEFSKNDFPNGIGQFIILDDNGSVISWRWINIEHQDKLSIESQINKSAFSLRDRVVLDFCIKDHDGNPVEANVAVSVVKAFTLNKNRMNITNRHHRMPVFSPYSNTDSPVDRALYLGQFECLSEERDPTGRFYPDHMPELDGHLISGRIVDADTGIPLKKHEVVLSVVGKKANCFFDITNNNGQFFFVTNLSGINEIVIQPLEQPESNYYVELDQTFFNKFDAFEPTPFYLDTSKLEDLNNAIIASQVRNNYETVRETVTSGRENDTLHFYGKPERRVRLDQFIALNSTREVIKELVPEVTVTRTRGHSRFKIYHKIGGERFQKSPFVMVDGTLFHEAGKVLDMSPADIETIDVINLKYFVGPVYLDGIMHFITRKGNLSTIDFDYSLFRLAYESCQETDPFHAPSYGSDTEKRSRIPDFRNTLYWNPNLRTNSEGLASVGFFTSDEPGEFTIFIEGMTSDGETIYATLPLIVE